MLYKVISGAQVGADIAGLRAAHQFGLETGGFVPRDRKTKDGPLPWALMHLFNLEEVNSPDYPERTRKNVLSSDGTMRLATSFLSRGEMLTARYCKELDKPRFDVNLHPGWTVATESAVAWILLHKIEVLNVAGNALPSIEPQVAEYLTKVFASLAACGGILLKAEAPGGPRMHTVTSP